MILGIDCSSKVIAIAGIYKDGNFFTKVCTSTKKDWRSRYENLFKEFNEVFNNLTDVQAVFIEDVPFVQNRQSFAKLLRIVSVCEQSCIKNNIPYFAVNNKTWKAQLIGDGNVSKESIKNFALLSFGDIVNSLTGDEIDALCLGRFGLLHLYQKFS